MSQDYQDDLLPERRAAVALTRQPEEAVGSIALRQALAAIALLMEKSMADSVCAIWLVDGVQLYPGAVSSLPASYQQAMEGRHVGEGAGACGTAAFRQASVVIEDLQTDPLMQNWRELLQASGLRACWATPVLSGSGQVLAITEVYQRRAGQPQGGELALIAAATRLARIALERAIARAALVNSEARFRELAENIEEVFYNRDARTGCMLYISPCYEKIWGRSCDSLYADPASFLEGVLAEDRAALALADLQNNAGESTDVQYRIRSTDGQIRWIRDHSYPVFNAHGALERVVGTAHDITDRKLADLALASTHRALQMLSRSSMAINRTDNEAGLLAEVCRVAVEVGNYRMAWVGYAQDDEARTIQPMAQAGHDAGYLSTIRLSWREDRIEGRGPAGQAIRSGQFQQSSDIGQAENHFLWREEALTRGYRSALFLPLRDEQRCFGVLCLYADQAQHFPDDEVQLLQELADNLAFGLVNLRARLERRRSQAVVRLAAAKVLEQASLLDRAQDAIMVLNLDRTLRYWNKGAERLYGWTSDEVLGQTMDERMYRRPQTLANAMDQTLASHGDWTGELEQVARDGSVVWVEARWTVVRNERGDVNGVLGINTDIRERKRAREEILRLNASLEERVQKRTAQLEFANKQLEAFSYSVSHDLRTPLSSVDGFSSLLEKSLSQLPGGPQAVRNQHFLARIRAGINQMGDLIDAMLSLAQISRSTLRWESADLSAMARALLNAYQEREPDRVAQLTVEPGLVAQGDPRLLQQVLDNLLGNAWKFSAGQARTEITFSHAVNDSGERVYVVRDNGAGFDMAYSEKLFGAFQRLHSPSEFAGSGIGLTTVQRIILRHGGRVWGQSEPGRGATFYFTLGTVKL